MTQCVVIVFEQLFMSNLKLKRLIIFAIIIALGLALYWRSDFLYDMFIFLWALFIAYICYLILRPRRHPLHKIIQRREQNHQVCLKYATERDPHAIFIRSQNEVESNQSFPRVDKRNPHQLLTLLCTYEGTIRQLNSPKIALRKSTIVPKDDPYQLGVFTEEPIKRRQLIGEYLGQLECEQNKKYPNRQSMLEDSRYTIGLHAKTENGYLVRLNAKTYRNWTAYMNSSRTPNVTAWIYFDKYQHPHALMFADRKIKSGEELTWDYQEQIETLGALSETCPFIPSQ